MSAVAPTMQLPMPVTTTTARACLRLSGVSDVGRGARTSSSVSVLSINRFGKAPSGSRRALRAPPLIVSARTLL